MPNIEGLGLQNFRTFKNKEILEFAPITIITGTNNAGKSSVFRAIQFLVNNFKDGITTDTLDFQSMKHELGNLDRIFNRVSMADFKNKVKGLKSQDRYSRVSDFREKNVEPQNDLPIFEKDEDLVFVFPIKIGGSRYISATLEIRYELRNIVNNQNDAKISHELKSVAILQDGKYLHWSNIIGLREYSDEAAEWEMTTSIDLKKIIELIDTPFKDKNEGLEPNEGMENYFTIDLFARIEKHQHIFLDFPFFNYKKDSYETFTKKIIEGKSLFSDYSDLTDDEKSRLAAIEERIINELFQGKYNNQYKILECFKHHFSNSIDGMEKEIVSAELVSEEQEELQETSEEKNRRKFFEAGMYQTTPNSELFTSLMSSIENDFLETVQKKIDTLKRVYFLPTTRGRNREWFIDEQNGEDIQIVRDFSSIYLEHHQEIQNFVNFWIGNGEIEQLDNKGNKKQKGFKIGKELSVFRDETIGLTKVFLINFDGTKTPLIDLGYGLSQLLPIIMKIAIIAEKHKRVHEYDFNNKEGYYQKQTIYFVPSTLLIEEPEANLHPSLQSKMAELLIDASSRFNIQFLIETHSEYLIYKFQEYIGKKIISPNAIKMYYFNHPNDVREGIKKNYISRVHIDKDGSIDYEEYFGEGFFDEQNNLKLSLFNLRRDHFIEDYDLIKDKLKRANETIEGYDTKIGELSQDLSNASTGKETLEEQLKDLKLEKEKKELEFQKLIKEQEEIIDDYTTKNDYSKYKEEIERIIDKEKIDNSKTLQYLSTGKYLLNTLDDNADFAPVIIQYGRAVECEMIKWMNDFKTSTEPSDISSWSTTSNYGDKLTEIFDNLGITKSGDVIEYELEPGNIKKINFYHLKTFSNNTSTSYKFGNLTQIFELIHYISPSKSSSYNYNSVPLMEEFSNYLKGVWANYDTAEGLFNNYRHILDLRNCAGHTYIDGTCNGDRIDRNTATEYVAKVEEIFGCM